MTDGEIIAARARRCVGARFRPQGRDCANRLYCIGVAAFALALSGVRANYRLRGGSAKELVSELKAARLRSVDTVSIGDVLVMRAGPEQLHLGIATEIGFVHAHAGLGRVVETPGSPEWPVLSVWRRTAGEGE